MIWLTGRFQFFVSLCRGMNRALRLPVNGLRTLWVSEFETAVVWAPAICRGEEYFGRMRDSERCRDLVCQ